jgi:hypothetical protein
MATELPIGSWAAIATIIAALIAAAISFVNLTLTKEQKTSEFRQQWIDALRQDLATFFATARAMVRASQEFVHPRGESNERSYFNFTEQKISDLRFASAETYYRIQLRLNPKKAKHEQLRHLIQVFITLQHQTGLTAGGDTNAMLQAIDAAAAYAPKMLKIEWERVKKGELAFRLARNWVAPMLFFGLIGCALYVFWACKLKIC